MMLDQVNVAAIIMLITIIDFVDEQRVNVKVSLLQRKLSHLFIDIPLKTIHTTNIIVLLRRLN